MHSIQRAVWLAATTLVLLTTATVARADDVPSNNTPPSHNAASPETAPPPDNPVAPPDNAPLDHVVAITLHHDGPGSRPERESLVRFGVAGEPLAYLDWICLQTDADVGPSITLDPASLSVLDDDGHPVGSFSSGSGRTHAFRAWHYSDGSGQHYRYCSKVLPREYRVDTVRFSPTPGASTTFEHLSLALRGDVRGCAGHVCGELRPVLASFAYGFSAMHFAHLDASRWQGSEITDRGLSPGSSRLRITAFVPVWTTAISSPHGFQPDIETGLAIPVTLATEATTASTGSGMGVGAGLYWAQCLNLRAPVTPRVCAGVEIDVSFERSEQAGGSNSFGPHVLGGWYVSIGGGPR